MAYDNWFLYITGEEFLDQDGERIRKGDAGVGQCSMSPGIMDCPHGIMYVISKEELKKTMRHLKLRSASPYNIRRAIKCYYSVPQEGKKN